MATTPSTPSKRKINYPSSDGRPVAETDEHRDNLLDSIAILASWFAGHPLVYVSGNLLVYYVPGDKRKRVSPDVFVVRGVPKRKREYYLVWEEGKSPEVVIEITSKSTQREDVETKFKLYQDILKVQEYFLFDPFAEYLKPPLQGYRLRRGRYARIRPVAGRLPSAILGLHLERNGSQLRLYDPATVQRLLTPQEWADQAMAARVRAEQILQRTAAENEMLLVRRELEALRLRLPKE